MRSHSTTYPMNSPVVEHPIFIVGAGRSGTTLLRSLLSAHSRIAIAPETHFMKRADEAGGLGKRGVLHDFDAFWNKYTSSLHFKDLGVGVDRCRALIGQQENQTCRGIFGALLAAYGERVGKPRVGEKTPGHVYFVGHLLEWFPDAQVLVLQRDPRAMVASQMHTPWVRDVLTPFSLRRGIFVGKRISEVARLSTDWARIYEQTVPAWQADPRVLTLSYETLVHDAEGEMQKVCEFIGETYEPTMLTSRTAETVPVPAGTTTQEDRWRDWRREHHAQTLRPVSADSLSKWKAELTPVEVAFIEGQCIRGMLAAGYTPTSPTLQRSLGLMSSRALMALAGAEAWARARAKRMRRGVQH